MYATPESEVTRISIIPLDRSGWPGFPTPSTLSLVHSESSTAGCTVNDLRETFGSRTSTFCPVMYLPTLPRSLVVILPYVDIFLYPFYNKYTGSLPRFVQELECYRC